MMYSTRGPDPRPYTGLAGGQSAAVWRRPAAVDRIRQALWSGRSPLRAGRCGFQMALVYEVADGVGEAGARGATSTERSATEI